MNKKEFQEKIKIALSTSENILLFAQIQGVYYMVKKESVKVATPEIVNSHSEMVCLIIETGKEFGYKGNSVSLPDKNTAFDLLNFMSKDLKVPLKASMTDIPLLRFKYCNHE